MAGKIFFDIIVTLDPNYMNGEELRRIMESGATIIRVNGSFLLPSSIEKMVRRIRENCGDKVDILLDLPGFKPRFTHLENEIRYEADVPMIVDLKSINYPEIITHMEMGDALRINDGMVRLTIDRIDGEKVVVIPDRAGKLRRGKGFYLEKRGYRPASHCLTDLDVELINLAKKNGIDYVGISFVYDMEDIELVKSLLKGSRTGFIPKIEARESLEPDNLLPILFACEKVIIDRGDLSGELGLESVWYYQRKVLDLAGLYDCRVIMATQFFTNMIRKPLPSIAEIDSLIDLIHFGIDGVQLSEETCIGSHGVDVVRLITENVARVRGKTGDQDGNLGHVLWLMGPTSSGKSTLADALAERLGRSKIPVVRLDGDEIRDLFGPNFSFEPEDRLLVVKSLSHHAKKAARAGANVIVSALTAYEDAREFIRNDIENLTVAYLDCPIDKCARRDPKGLYAKSINGKINTLVGVNSEYLPPKDKDFTLDTSVLSLEECMEKLLYFLTEENRLRLWDQG